MLDCVRSINPKHLWWARIQPLSWEHQLGSLIALSRLSRGDQASSKPVMYLLSPFASVYSIHCSCSK